jgi:hypothetical protein
MGTVILLLALIVLPCAVLFSYALCRMAGECDDRIEQWQNEDQFTKARRERLRKMQGR